MTAMLMSTSQMQVVRTASTSRPVQARRSSLGVKRASLRPVLRRGKEELREDGVGLPRPSNQAVEQIDDVKEPKIDQTKPQNIQPGNISAENAERRADIGATRPPTLFGRSLPASLLCFSVSTGVTL